MTKIKNIIKLARGDMSQTAFAKVLGKTQGLISKYEHGDINPPSDVLERCMAILDTNNQSDDVDIDVLTKRISNELKAPQLAYARKTIETILDGIQASHR